MCLTTFGNILENKLTELGISKVDFAKEIDINVSRLYVYLNKPVHPPEDILKKICAKTGLVYEEMVLVCGILGKSQKEEFSERLKKAMLEAGINERELRLKLKVSRLVMKEYLEGKRVPSRKIIRVIVEQLSLDEDYFYR